jgi:hypothetical protein
MKDFNPNDRDYNIASVDLLTNGDVKINPYELNRYTFVVPHHFDPRIKTQHSVFCCFPNLLNRFDLVNIINSERVGKNEVSKNDTGYIEKFVIDGKNKNRILDELNAIGVNHSTLFPDLAGFGEFVNWKLSNYS